VGPVYEEVNVKVKPSAKPTCPESC